jgi:hypothetical protein
MEPEVVTLKKFRDNILKKSALGRSFIKAYYRYSPPMARYISDKPKLKALVRWCLKPVVRAIKRDLR